MAFRIVYILINDLSQELRSPFSKSQVSPGICPLQLQSRGRLSGLETTSFFMEPAMALFV